MKINLFYIRLHQNIIQAIFEIGISIGLQPEFQIISLFFNTSATRNTLYTELVEVIKTEVKQLTTVPFILKFD